LGIRVVVTNENNTKDLEIFQINKKIFEKEFDISQRDLIKYISIDLNLNLLKEIKSIKIMEETNDFQLKYILLNQLKNGLIIIERIQAPDILKFNYLNEIMEVLTNTLLSSDFYNVLVEVANAFGSFNDKSDYSKTNYAYNNLIQCFKH
jgi:aminopeptidase N